MHQCLTCRIIFNKYRYDVTNSTVMKKINELSAQIKTLKEQMITETEQYVARVGEIIQREDSRATSIGTYIKDNKIYDGELESVSLAENGVLIMDARFPYLGKNGDLEIVTIDDIETAVEFIRNNSEQK